MMKSTLTPAWLPFSPRILFILLLTVWGGLIYANSLTIPFYLDDSGNITENQFIQIDKPSIAALIEAGFKSLSSRRPVANISLALNYYFHQDRVAGYHLINTGIHLLSGIFLYLLITLTMELEAKRTGQHYHVAIPFFAAGLWLLHPVQTQAVVYIVQRMTSMATMFFVLSLYCYGKGRQTSSQARNWWFCSCAGAAALALGSKEIAITLPFFILLFEFFFFGGQEKISARMRRFFPYLLLLTAIYLAAIFLVLGKNPVTALLQAYQVRDFTPAQRLLTESRIIFFYLSLLVFPHPSRLSLEHAFPLSNSLFEPITTLFSITGLVLLAATALFLARRERLISFAIIWFLANLALESTFLPLELIFEHRLYLPSMFFFFIPVFLAFRFTLKSLPVQAGFFLVILLFSFWTFERNRLWNTPVAFWQSCIEKAPKTARPYNNLGLELSRRGRFTEAIHYFREALRLKPDFYFAHNNLALCLLKTGQMDKARIHFNLALRGAPDQAAIHNNLGNIYAQQGNLTLAITHLSKALELNPKNAVYHNNMGNLLLLQGRNNAAILQYREALRLKPDYEDARYNLKMAGQWRDPGDKKEY